MFEMLIVMGIMGIAMLLVLPTLGEPNASRLISAADLLMADAGFAQIASLAHPEAPRMLVLEQANDRYWIATIDDPATPITNPVGGLPYVTTFGLGRAHPLDGVTIDGYALDGDNILGYAVDGSLDQETPATVTLAANGLKITITIDAVMGEATVGPVH